MTAADMLESLSREAHVWYCDPRAIIESERLAQYQAVLSEEERSQLNRFHFKNDQHNYLVSHALLRNALSKYADIHPEAWVFEAGAHGKPGLAPGLANAPLEFNLTHTDGMCACVITRDVVCGIDVEQQARNNTLLAIAQRMFAPAEVAALKNTADAALRPTFFRFWTLREAYLKALGSGLGGSSKAFHFEITDSGSSRYATASIRFDDSQLAGSADAWQFEVFLHESDHVLATALHTRGTPRTLRWRFMRP